MAKLTEWYPGHIKPVRVGVYQRYYASLPLSPCPPAEDMGFCLWNGDEWKQWYPTVLGASEGKVKAFYQDIPWRGLASDPEKGGK